MCCGGVRRDSVRGEVVVSGQVGTDSVRIGRWAQRVANPPPMWANPWGFWRSVGSVGVSRMILAIPAAIGSVAVGLQGITCYGVAWWRRDDLRRLNNSLRARPLVLACAIVRTD